MPIGQFAARNANRSHADLSPMGFAYALDQYLQSTSDEPLVIPRHTCAIFNGLTLIGSLRTHTKNGFG